MNLANCHGCGSRERPVDLDRPRWDIGIPFCPDCREIYELEELAYLASLPPHYPQNIAGTPMSEFELRAWGYPTEGWRS